MRKVQAGGIIRTSLDNTWRTPEWILERARMLLGDTIPLDVATGMENPTRAARFYASEPALDGPWSLFEVKGDGEHAGVDGLSAPWDAPWWCNPPFGRELPTWLAKIREEAWGRGQRGLALLPCSRWEQEYFTRTWNAASAVCFLRGRVKFISTLDGEAVGGNPSANMILGFNVDPHFFAEVWRPVGACSAIAPL